MNEEMKAHYIKWLNFANEYGIVLNEHDFNNLVPGKTKEDKLNNLKRLYNEDNHLNNIPLAKFDNLWNLRRNYPFRKPCPTILYQGACVYKTLLVKLLGELDNLID